MYTHLSYKIAITILILTLTLIAGFANASDKLKIGFVHVSAIGDAGWTYQHDQGRKAIAEEFADQVAIKVVENVPEGTAAERVVRELAASGHTLIFGTSFGFMNPMLKVAKNFPNTKFEHATGYKTAANLASYNARFYEGRYLAGIVAGSMTKSNVLGYVAAFPIPEVVQGINAYTLGAQSVNPAISVRVIWVNNWFDPGRERGATTALIDQQADVITHHTGSTAAVVAAQDRGVYAIAYPSDMSKFGPDAHLTAVTHHWGEYYKSRVRSVLDGTWKTGTFLGGIAEGMIDLAPLHSSVPAHVAAKVAHAQAAIADANLHPFAGPVVGQDDSVIVAAGVNLSDEQLSGMNYYVKGVVGSLPK